MSLQLLCRNKTKDFEKWRAVFRTHASAHREAGLDLKALWRSADDPNEAHFLFEVDDRGKAEAFMDDPDAARGASESGVLDGDYTFVIQRGGY